MPDQYSVSPTIIQATNYQLLDSRVLLLDDISTSNMEPFRLYCMSETASTKYAAAKQMS